MIKKERQESILKIIRERKYCTVNYLSKQLFVAPITVRRDLTEMETAGLIARCFGGATNTDGEMNGFIPLKNNEHEMLISLEKLLDAFRDTVPRHVKNAELFLISMIPFMRGYANIINNRSLFDELTQVMHGYKTEKVDIARAYTTLFGNHGEDLLDSYEICVSDILGKNC